jgi:small subunit ribosomal protein S8
MLTDPIADLLTRIRNALAANKKTVAAPYSRMKEAIVKILKSEGYIKDYQVSGDKLKKQLEIVLKYHQNQPLMTELVRISKPGVRLYSDKDQLYRFLRGPGIVILSTSKGIITGRKAKKLGIGGEIICQIS